MQNLPLSKKPRELSLSFSLQTSPLLSSLHVITQNMTNPMSQILTEPTSSSTKLTTTSSSSEEVSNDEDSINSSPSFHLNLKDIDLNNYQLISSSGYLSNFSYKSLSVLSSHIGSVSCLALCGDFLLSASQGKDIIVWQQHHQQQEEEGYLRQFTKFGQGDGSIKAMVTVENKVFTGHQDGKIRVWKVSISKSENVFKLVNSLPTRKDCLRKFMIQSNYVQIRRHQKRLWIEHADSISCLAVCNGLIYSGSWDKTIKVWRISDLKCLESIKAHDDAINGLVACKGLVFSASADGKIKAWSQNPKSKLSKSKSKSESLHCSKGILEGHNGVSMNSVMVSEDGKWVYGGASDGYLMVWEGIRSSDCNINNDQFLNWRLVCERKGHELAVLCMCLMGEEFLCSGSADKSIGIWRREDFGKVCKIGVISGHEGPVKCLQALNCSVGDGFLLYSGGLDKCLRVWLIQKNQEQPEHQQQNSEENSITIYVESF